MDEDRLSFLCRAKKATYAGHGAEADPSRPAYMGDELLRACNRPAVFRRFPQRSPVACLPGQTIPRPGILYRRIIRVCNDRRRRHGLVPGL